MSPEELPPQVRTPRQPRTLRWRLGFRRRSLLRLLRRRLAQADHLLLVALATVVGTSAGFGAVAVRMLIGFFKTSFYGVAGHLLPAAPGLPAWRIVLMPALGGLIIGPIIWYGAREARGHGVPEVMLAVLLRRGRIRPRVAVVKALASAICIGSGGSAGREGPMVQIGSSLGSTVGRLARLPQDGVRTLVAAGAAGGIAAAFNAPIAGAIFALEVILGDFAVASFSPVVISAVAATVISRAVEGDFAAFTVPAYELVSVWEFIPYTGLGVAAGLVAVTFIVFLYWQEQVWERLSFPEPLKPALGGLLVGSVALFYPHVLGVGYETINGAMLNEFPWELLLLLIPLKLAATSVTLSSGGSGGVFAPSLFLGAALGGTVGQAMATWAPHTAPNPGAYALVGMGAVVAATTQAPIAAILILFELTGNYQIILPLMTSCILSTLVAGLLKRESIYTQKLKWRGISLEKGREEGLLRSLPVRRLLQREFTVFHPNAELDAMLSRALADRQEIYPVVDAEGELRGLVRFADLRATVRDQEALSQLVVAEDVALPPVWVDLDDDLSTALRRFTEHEVRGLPVKSKQKLMGMIYEQDVIALYSRELDKLELANAVMSRSSFRPGGPGVDLGGGLRLDEVPTPPAFAGQTLRQADLRRLHGVEILYLNRSGERQVFPDPDLVLEPSDRLIVLGEPGALQSLRDS